jgi:VanZ family protein
VLCALHCASMVKHLRRLKPRVNRSILFRTGLWIGVVAWATTIVWLSSLSGPELARLTVFKVWDKAAHFVAFAIGAMLLTMALHATTRWNWKRICWTALVAVALFGATDEWHQRYTPQRHGADAADWICDVFGAAVGTLIAVVVHVRYQRKSCPASVRD